MTLPAGRPTAAAATSDCRAAPWPTTVTLVPGDLRRELDVTTAIMKSVLYRRLILLVAICLRTITFVSPEVRLPAACYTDFLCCWVTIHQRVQQTIALCLSVCLSVCRPFRCVNIAVQIDENSDQDTV